ncbi:hypothetical protein ABAC460_09275 [Asticcacaulis sp. AC460]|uniref:hypothetical protein n=1 Tax=Asticcacaulis sp. AC460 TaxID=1282360 RepID=UPI0003C3FCDA|nr:hypothetical protein [Asticcacaulis sp. AC460]ESQ90335.1 hypothetical protein ABAC460_09275 [Asticcacaulis sp. AC460]
MDRPRDDNNFHTSTDNAPDLFGEKAGQSQSATDQRQNLDGLSQVQGGNAFASTAGLTGDLTLRTPDSGVGQAGDPTFASEVHDNAADSFAPEPRATEGTHSEPREPNAVDAVTYEGKRVFSPHELNQAGEDKEYFHPDKHHKFDAPKDANDHALTPDIEVKPDNTVGRVG